MTDWFKQSISLGMNAAQIIPVSQIVVGDWVPLKCQFGCGGYDKWLTCPPYSPPPEVTRRMLRDYEHALLLRLEGLGGEEEEEKQRLKLHEAVVELEREMFLAGYHRAWGMTAGPCPLCETCDVTAPCKYPEKARPAMEACGIDVYSTVRKAGWEISVVPTIDSPFSLFGLVLME